jgi:hypothetical protein
VINSHKWLRLVYAFGADQVLPKIRALVIYWVKLHSSALVDNLVVNRWLPLLVRTLLVKAWLRVPLLVNDQVYCSILTWLTIWFSADYDLVSKLVSS